MDEIRIVDLEVFANHGVFPEENALGQKFIVNLVLRGDFSAACKSDVLEIDIELKKPWAPIGLPVAYASVKITRGR